MSVSSLGYLRNNKSKFHQIFVASDRARSSSGGVAIGYVFPVLWMMTSGAPIMGVCRASAAGVVLKITHQGAASVRKQSRP